MSVIDPYGLSDLGRVVDTVIDAGFRDLQAESPNEALSVLTGDAGANWGLALGELKGAYGIEVRPDAGPALAEIIRNVANRLGQEDVDDRAFQHALDNLKSMIKLSLLLADLRGTPLDSYAIDGAYRMACPVYPCLPRTEPVQP